MGHVRTSNGLKNLKESSVFLKSSIICPNIDLMNFQTKILWWDGALTLRPPTNWQHDIPTNTKCPLNILTTEPFYYCDTLPPPSQYVQVTNVYPPKSCTFCHCVRMSTFFHLECDRTSTFALKWNVDIVSHVTSAHLEVFWLVWWGVEEISQWSKSGPDDGTHWRMDQLGVCLNLT
jgi:hypothetical protein